MRAAACVLACLVLAGALPARAEDLAVAHVGPPSWWSSDQPQEIALLIEGAGLDGTAVRFEDGPLRVERVEHGDAGRALIATVAILAGAESRDYVVIIEKGDQARRVPWTLEPAPAYRPRGIGPDDVIYLIMPDRFANGDPGNDAPDGHEAMLNRARFDTYHGGDFAGIRERLPYLADLGVTALWLTPIYRPAPRWYEFTANGATRRMADYHGYSLVEFYDINPRFGTADEYRRLVDEAHRLGLKVIQDQIVGYVGPQHRWAKAPPFEAWIHGPLDKPPHLTFRFDALTNPHATEADRRGMTDGWFFGILPDLNMRDARVARYAMQQSLWWATRFDADGARLDTYPMVDRSFWRDWSQRVREERPGLDAVGEAWVLDPADLCFFQGGRAGWDGIDPGVSLVFDFPLFGALTGVASSKDPASLLAKTLARDGLYPHPERLVTFLDNHDTTRLAGVAGVTPSRYRLAVAFLLTMRGIPQMTWGDEIGLPGHADDRRDFPGGFPGDPADAFTKAGRTPEQRATFDTWRTLLNLRKASPALRRGRLVDLLANESVYAFARLHDDERVVVALNFGGSAAEVALPVGELGAFAEIVTLHGTGEARPAGATLRLALPAESAGVFRLAGPE
jgi:glycosidase